MSIRLGFPEPIAPRSREGGSASFSNRPAASGGYPRGGRMHADRASSGEIGVIGEFSADGAGERPKGIAAGRRRP